MQGDFSRWDPLGDPNRAGVLHQQGRVLLDRDWNDGVRIATEWQDTAARDTIGPGVCAVPSSQPWAFRVEKAEVIGGNRVELTVSPGRAWADGLQVNLPRSPADDGLPPDPDPVTRSATYLDASVQTTPGSIGSIANGTRDAVILEVWRETLSAFQVPGELLEPALGGPDTTERILTSFRFRLARLAADEDCHTVALGDQPHGALSVTLRPADEIDGDCPVPDDGGYTGFEHQLYRVEIARVNDATQAWFKHSRFNGGLVGRGVADLSPGPKRFLLTGNHLAVRTAGQTAFYLEVVSFDALAGAWRPVYGAEVQLDGDHLNVQTEHLTLAPPAEDSTVFFRLWDGIRRASDFPAGGANPVELAHGIRLEFHGAAGTYRPGDYWTFSVRAGGLANDETLLDEAPPQGIRYHRVPLAELTWAAAGSPVDEDTIQDCRRIFRPLTDLDGCCTLTVGDGVYTHGDFDDVQAAIDHLPDDGGRVCLLPGTHHAAARIINRTDVEITGCGRQTLVVPLQVAEEQDPDPPEPLFLIGGSTGVAIRNLSMLTPTGTAVRVDDEDDEVDESAGPSSQIRVEHNLIVAGVHGVEARPRNDQGGDNDVVISHNMVGLMDRDAGRAAILVSADGVVIERNRVVVVPPHDKDDPSDPRPDDTPPDPTFDDCAEPQAMHEQGFPLLLYLTTVLIYIVSVGAAPRALYRARGGIQVVGGSERVRILENEVVGGRGHGVTLGELPRGGGDAAAAPDTFFIATLTTAQTATMDRDFVGALYDVEIDRNVIRDVGMCGIGVAAFFAPELSDAAGAKRTGYLVRVEGLTVSRNRIERCVRDPEPIPQGLRRYAGLGGIALADCAGAEFVRNRVEGNGDDTGEPVCGIFMLTGDRVSLEGNTVLRNGPSVRQDAERALAAGWRAGIVVGFAMARLIEAFTFNPDQDPVRDGLPAARVVGNVVAQPLGQALVLGAIGPVAVTGNSLTALDVDYRAAPLTLLGATVLIVDLAISKDLMLTTLFFSGAGRTNFSGSAASGRMVEQFEALVLLPSGGVLFTDNQVTLDLRGRQVGGALSSVTIASLDDIGFMDNQSECTSFVDVVLVNTLLAGFTVRASDNRFQEGFTWTAFSLFSWAMMNTATMNQSTHCLSVNAPPDRKLDFGNQVWMGTSVSPLGYRTCGEGRDFNMGGDTQSNESSGFLVEDVK